MKIKLLFSIVLATLTLTGKGNSTDHFVSKAGDFNIEKDLLLVQLDCKTDVDDLHTAAAFATLMADDRFSKVKYHVVAGTYGIQEGLYVPPNDLLELAFANNWTDAPSKFQCNPTANLRLLQAAVSFW